MLEPVNETACEQTAYQLAHGQCWAARFPLL